MPSYLSTSQETTTEAVEAPTVSVDPGQIIRVNARFPDAPESIRFSFLPPQTVMATHDPGAYEIETKIQREGADLYYYNIDTRLMHGGLGWWYFYSDDSDPEKRRAKVGKFVVRDVPRALLTDKVVEVGGGEAPKTAAPARWPWIVGSAVAGTAVGALIGALAFRHGSSATVEGAAEDAAADAIVETAAIQLARPRAADGKFLSASSLASSGAADPESVELVKEVNDEVAGMSGGSVALIAVGVAAVGALGIWLWRRHLAASASGEAKALPAHVLGEMGDGFDILGID